MGRGLYENKKGDNKSKYAFHSKITRIKRKFILRRSNYLKTKWVY